MKSSIPGREVFRCALDSVLDRTGVVAAPDYLPRAGGRGYSLPVRGNWQIDSYSCGAVAAAMIARYLKPQISFDQAWHAVRPSRVHGAGWSKVTRGLRQLGIRVSSRRHLTFRDMRSAVDQGRPIATVVATNDPFIQHWVVLYGYETRPSRVLVANYRTVPLLRRGKFMAWQDFRNTWAEPGRALVCGVRRND